MILRAAPKNEFPAHSPHKKEKTLVNPRFFSWNGIPERTRTSDTQFRKPLPLDLGNVSKHACNTQNFFPTLHLPTINDLLVTSRQIQLSAESYSGLPPPVKHVLMPSDNYMPIYSGHLCMSG
jgi:hypothetical protein